MIEVYGSGDIEMKSLINRPPLDSKGEVMKDRHDIFTGLLVTSDVADGQEEITAMRVGPSTGRAATTAPGPNPADLQARDRKYSLDWSEVTD